jgi:hypothetical protein
MSKKSDINTFDIPKLFLKRLCDGILENWADSTNINGYSQCLYCGCLKSHDWPDLNIYEEEHKEDCPTIVVKSVYKYL